MRIAYFLNENETVSQTFVQELLSGFRAAGDDVVVACNTSKQIPRDDVHVIRYGVPTRSDRFLNRLSRLRRDYGQRAGFGRRLATARRRVTKFLRQVRPDVAYVDFVGNAVMAREGLRSASIPFVVHAHGFDVTQAFSNPYYREAAGAVFREASSVIVASHHVRRLIELEGAPRDNIQVVRYGVHTDGVAPASWLERSREPSVVHFGRLTPKKHPIALVEAFRLVREEIDDARLHLIGDGPLRESVEQRIRSLDLKHAVVMHGALARAEALQIVRKCWVFAQHSVTAVSGDQEGFGLSPAEAALLELPVVSTWHNGIPEHVAHNETGLLVHEHDYEAMAESMIALLRDRSLAQRMGAEGHSNVLRLCDGAKRIETIRGLLSRAVEQGGRAMRG